jgi:Protein of unknown function (DUF1566)
MSDAKEAVPMRRLVAVLAVLLSVAGAHAQSDHLACYKVRDSQAKAKYTADIDGLVLQPRCVVKVPAAMACVPATKSNVTPTPPGGGGTGTPNPFLCYKMRCPKTTLPTLAGSDQFGSRTVTPSAAKLVCAPLAGPSTTTTTTTSTTTTTTSMPSGCALLATGQTFVYSLGDDGNLRKGTPLSYTDNGDGTVTDNNTGLVWEKLSQDHSDHNYGFATNWGGAFAHIATLNSESFAGHNDWRLPNLRELHSIVNLESAAMVAVSPAFNMNCTVATFGCTVLECSCTLLHTSYWSSTSFAPDLGVSAWVVNFDVGFVSAVTKTSVGGVRAVRGGS